LQSDLCAAGLNRFDNLVARSTQALAKPAHLSRLATSIHPLEGNKHAALRHVR
jgi:hypothetical protein